MQSRLAKDRPRNSSRAPQGACSPSEGIFSIFPSFNPQEGASRRMKCKVKSQRGQATGKLDPQKKGEEVRRISRPFEGEPARCVIFSKDEEKRTPVNLKKRARAGAKSLHCTPHGGKNSDM